MFEDDELVGEIERLGCFVIFILLIIISAVAISLA